MSLTTPSESPEAHERRCIVIDPNTSLWSDPARTRYFLIADDQPLVAGSYEIRTVTGRRQDVEAEQLARFEVTRDEAREWLDRQLDVMVERVKGAVTTMLERLLMSQPNAPSS